MLSPPALKRTQHPAVQLRIRKPTPFVHRLHGRRRCLARDLPLPRMRRRAARLPWSRDVGRAHLWTHVLRGGAEIEVHKKGAKTLHTESRLFPFPGLRRVQSFMLPPSITGGFGAARRVHAPRQHRQRRRAHDVARQPPRGHTTRGRGDARGRRARSSRRAIPPCGALSCEGVRRAAADIRAGLTTIQLYYCTTVLLLYYYSITILL